MVNPPLREALIGLDAIRGNVARLVDSCFVADVAGDGFGHGAIRVAAAAVEAGATVVGVRDAREQRALECAGIAARIVRLPDAGSAVSAAMYGIGPLARESGCIAALRVSARVMSLKTIEAGEAVSYGYTWRASVRTNLALVPLGYADGVTRAAGNIGRVLLAGAMRPIVGRVAMDVIVLDLGDDEVELGAEAVLFGGPAHGAATADEWAAALGISALEATSGIGARVARRWI